MLSHFLYQVENEQRAQLPSKQGTSPEQTSALEESIFKLSGQLSTINRNQKYFRTRENRNFSTVRSTERRIFNFSVIESLMMVTMAGLQVFTVRFFFQGARKGTFLDAVAEKLLANHPQVMCKRSALDRLLYRQTCTRNTPDALTNILHWTPFFARRFDKPRLQTLIDYKCSREEYYRN